MAARLTDKQKKKIIADYVEMGSYNAVGKINGVAPNTVKKIVDGNADIAEMCNHKKEENRIDILSHMETKRDKVCQIIDIYLDELIDVKHFDKVTPNQLTTALGTLIDKFTLAGVSRTAAEQTEKMLALADVIRAPVDNRNIEDFDGEKEEKTEG